MAVDSRVRKRSIFVSAEGEHRLVHLLGIEDPESNKEMKVLNRQTRHCHEQVRLELGDDVLECVFAEVREIHESRYAGGELDELLLHKFALGFEARRLGLESRFVRTRGWVSSDSRSRTSTGWSLSGGPSRREAARGSSTARHRRS